MGQPVAKKYSDRPLMDESFRSSVDLVPEARGPSEISQVVELSRAEMCSHLKCCLFSEPQRQHRPGIGAAYFATEVLPI